MRGGVGEVLVGLHEPAGQREAAAERVLAARDEQDVQRVVADGQATRSTVTANAGWSPAR